MSGMTYEFETKTSSLETYEWDNVWWEHAGSCGIPRVLYIGDSISYNTRRIATKVSEETLYFDGFATSKALDNPYFQSTLSLFAKQQGERSCVLFNNGLHGWHLADDTDYADHYEVMLQFLMRELNGAPLAVLLTTHVSDPARDQRVIARNRVAAELARKYGLPMVDLYALTFKHEHLLAKDGVHFEKAGYELLAKTLVTFVKTII